MNLKTTKKSQPLNLQGDLNDLIKASLSPKDELKQLRRENEALKRVIKSRDKEIEKLKKVIEKQKAKTS